MSDTSRLIKIALAFAFLTVLGVSQAPAVWGRIDRAAAPARVQAGAREEFFEKKVRPIFANSCQLCHNSKAK
ncbi:MAG: hypothetical protein MOB07_15125, partial [Acidobacteria bacterium]|nr:hypothetical protein [Acidobacteriota bacterium]